ncbi:MAG TPA: glutathione S-transferase family protein [Polyangiaceae bacterium]|nr:glutathione S-transferase family protein [Polyangiaceae bacterium]
MSKERRLVQLSYSPWSERARWALDHHGIAYRTVEHLPFLGELRLRRIVGKKDGPATVPVLIDGDAVLRESWDIARYADRTGSGSKLIAAEQESDIRAWTELADQASSHVRALVVSALLTSEAALDEGLPFSLPPWLSATMRPVTRVALRWFARKYGVSSGAAAEHEDRMRPALDRLRSAVKTSPYLLGRFSYADIAMATLLQGISPVGNGYIRLGPATRRAWTRPTLESAYADLVRWRDNLYLEHRGRATAPPVAG